MCITGSLDTLTGKAVSEMLISDRISKGVWSDCGHDISWTRTKPIN